MGIWQRRVGVQLCSPFEEKRLLKWRVPAVFCQPKLDGERCRAIIENKEVRLISSEGNEIYSVPHIAYALAEQLGHMDYLELDGELYHHGMSFEEIHSRVGRTKNIHDDCGAIQYHVFDIIQASRAGHVIEQDIRIGILNALFEIIAPPIIPVHSRKERPVVSDIWEAMDDYTSDGYEGIIVRHPFAIYERKRSLYIMKFKPKQSDIYEIVGCEEEISQHGIPKNSLGAFICAGPNGERFNVGSGFTQAQRKYYWENRGELIGNFAKIKFQHRTSKGVPRFPIFIELEWMK